MSELVERCRNSWNSFRPTFELGFAHPIIAGAQLRFGLRRELGTLGRFADKLLASAFSIEYHRQLRAA